nr:F-box protein At5g03100-like [Tanacetum cinerariifolium]
MGFPLYNARVLPDDTRMGLSSRVSEAVAGLVLLIRHDTSDSGPDISSTYQLLRDVELDEESIQNILSGSPLLETLEFNECFGFRRIYITSKSVKNLVFYGYHALVLGGYILLTESE